MPASELVPASDAEAERQQQHERTQAKLANLQLENRARAEKLKWLYELSAAADEDDAAVAAAAAAVAAEEQREQPSAPASRFYGDVRYATPATTPPSTPERARRAWKQGWRRLAEEQAVAGKLQYLAHLDTRHSWHDGPYHHHHPTATTAAAAVAGAGGSPGWGTEQQEQQGEMRRHQPMYGTLHVVAARDLKSADAFDKNPGSDPYVQVTWNGVLIGRSRVIEDSCAPLW
jgi:hypothetical protein